MEKIYGILKPNIWNRTEKCRKNKEERVFMKNIKHLCEKTGVLIAGLLLSFGMTAFAAPSVEGDTQLTAVTDQIVSADYTITSDDPMESASITISYDKDALTYTSGSGGNNFSGNGGNGTVQLSSKPGDTTAEFSIKFKGKADEDTELTITACTITVDGKEIDVLTGENVSEEEAEKDNTDAESEEESEDEERASFVIDERTFYVRRPDDLEGFDVVHMDIQGFDCRVLKHNDLDLYVVKLISDNGSYRDNFVYNPDTGNVIPFVQKESGTDTVIFIEPEEDGYVPTRYVYVDMPWGAKYTIPAYKHVTIDGVDEIQDDSNRYLVYGINQDGEKAWYGYDYDKDSLQLFDDVAYQGEQNYILYLDETVSGLSQEAAYQLERYNTNMGRRLTIILIMTIFIVLLVNALVILYLKMRKMQMPEQEMDGDEEEDSSDRRDTGEYIVGSLEENEMDFQEPVKDDPGDDGMELEIIDLDDMDGDEEE